MKRSKKQDEEEKDKGPSPSLKADPSSKADPGIEFDSQEFPNQWSKLRKNIFLRGHEYSRGHDPETHKPPTFHDLELSQSDSHDVEVLKLKIIEHQQRNYQNHNEKLDKVFQKFDKFKKDGGQNIEKPLKDGPSTSKAAAAANSTAAANAATSKSIKNEAKERIFENLRQKGDLMPSPDIKDLIHLYMQHESIIFKEAMRNDDDVANEDLAEQTGTIMPTVDCKNRDTNFTINYSDCSATYDIICNHIKSLNSQGFIPDLYNEFINNTDGRRKIKIYSQNFEYGNEVQEPPKITIIDDDNFFGTSGERSHLNNTYNNTNYDANSNTNYMQDNGSENRYSSVSNTTTQSTSQNDHSYDNYNTYNMDNSTNMNSNNDDSNNNDIGINNNESPRKVNYTNSRKQYFDINNFTKIPTMNITSKPNRTNVNNKDIIKFNINNIKNISPRVNITKSPKIDSFKTSSRSNNNYSNVKSVVKTAYSKGNIDNMKKKLIQRKSDDEAGPSTSNNTARKRINKINESKHSTNNKINERTPRKTSESARRLMSNNARTQAYNFYDFSDILNKKYKKEPAKSKDSPRTNQVKAHAQQTRPWPYENSHYMSPRTATSTRTTTTAYETYADTESMLLANEPFNRSDGQQNSFAYSAEIQKWFSQPKTSPTNYDSVSTNNREATLLELINTQKKNFAMQRSRSDKSYNLEDALKDCLDPKPPQSIYTSYAFHMHGSYTSNSPVYADIEDDQGKNKSASSKIPSRSEDKGFKLPPLSPSSSEESSLSLAPKKDRTASMQCLVCHSVAKVSHQSQDLNKANSDTEISPRKEQHHCRLGQQNEAQKRSQSQTYIKTPSFAEPKEKPQKEDLPAEEKQESQQNVADTETHSSPSKSLDCELSLVSEQTLETIKLMIKQLVDAEFRKYNEENKCRDEEYSSIYSVPIQMSCYRELLVKHNVSIPPRILSLSIKMNLLKKQSCLQNNSEQNMVMTKPSLVPEVLPDSSVGKEKLEIKPKANKNDYIENDNDNNDKEDKEEPKLIEAKDKEPKNSNIDYCYSNTDTSHVYQEPYKAQCEKKRSTEVQNELTCKPSKTFICEPVEHFKTFTLPSPAFLDLKPVDPNLAASTVQNNGGYIISNAGSKSQAIYDCFTFHQVKKIQVEGNHQDSIANEIQQLPPGPFEEASKDLEVDEATPNGANCLPGLDCFMSVDENRSLDPNQKPATMIYKQYLCSVPGERIANALQTCRDLGFNMYDDFHDLTIKKPSPEEPTAPKTPSSPLTAHAPLTEASNTYDLQPDGSLASPNDAEQASNQDRNYDLNNKTSTNAKKSIGLLFSGSQSNITQKSQNCEIIFKNHKLKLDKESRGNLSLSSATYQIPHGADSQVSESSISIYEDASEMPYDEWLGAVAQAATQSQPPAQKPTTSKQNLREESEDIKLVRSVLCLVHAASASCCGPDSRLNPPPTTSSQPYNGDGCVSNKWKMSGFKYQIGDSLLIEDEEADLVIFPNGDVVPAYHGCSCMIGQYLLIVALVCRTGTNNLELLSHHLSNKLEKKGR